MKNVTKDNRMLSEVLNDRSRVRDMRSTIRMICQHSRLVIKTAIENCLSSKIFTYKMK